MPKTSRSSLMWFLPAALLGAMAVLGLACGSSDGGDTSGGAGCTPGAQSSCACPGGTTEGIQVCSSDGTAFGACECGDTSSTTSTTTGGGTLCGNSVVDAGEDCDDGNTENNDGCTIICKAPFCGDGIQEAGEACDDGNNSEFDACPPDCGIGQGSGGGGGMGAGGGGTGGSGGDPCAGVLTYAGMTAAGVAVPWVSGALLGTEAGTAMCQAIGADHICDYEEIKLALANGELNNDPNVVAGGAAGVTAWVHRTTPENVDPSTHHPDANAPVSMAGPGGRCNEWTYTTNHISDGEYVVLTNSGGTTSSMFWLDHDTLYDGVDTSHAIAGELQCGSTSRRIACCYPACQ